MSQDKDKKWLKLNDSKMNRVRAKMERATGILSDCLGDIQMVPCLKSEDVKTLSEGIDELNKCRVRLEQSYKAKVRPENWND